MAENDEATIKAIILNMINQKQLFRDIGEKGELPSSFNVQNLREFVLGIFTGIVINLFANYWIGEHEAGLSPDELDFLNHKIVLSNKMILDGLFE